VRSSFATVGIDTPCHHEAELYRLKADLLLRQTTCDAT
jgi:hypothetical protein